MVKVRFKTRSSGPNGQILPGQIVEVPDGEAELLIGGGYAERLEVFGIDISNGPDMTARLAPEKEKAQAGKEAGKSEIQGDKPADSGARKPGGRKNAHSGAARRK